MRTTLALLGVTFALTAACGGDGGETGPITVGLLAPKSGALQEVGSSFERVAITAVESINAKGGVSGRQLNLIVDDTQTQAELADEKLQGLIDMGAIAVVGPATSGEVTNAWPVATMNKVPIISPSSTAPGLSRTATQGGPDDDGYMFRNVPDDEIQSVAMAYYLARQRQPMVTKVAVVYESSAYGQGLKDAFKTAFERLVGTDGVALEVGFAQNLATADAMPVIQQLAAADPDPTMVVMIALEQDALKLVTAWDNGGTPIIPNMQWFMTDGARSSGFLTAAPASVRRMCGTAPTYPDDGDAYSQLADAYTRRFPQDSIGAQIYAPNVWDAYHLLAAAMVAQQSQHPGEPLGGEHLRDAITTVSKTGQIFHAGQWRDLVSALRAGNDVDYDGAAGPNDFDLVGQAVGPYEVWCISADGAQFDQTLFLNAQEIQMLRNAN